ncbi:redox-sensing transcriptional repressor Rex [uncultured Peptoniphilus sp.]|uniref:redox-sensing transcriptional repressor Rex n=1 Tax=uncultured Peptoniphilus sp. TaxID=254354 RepID=UPI0028063711|nr:redox-sensing transcriptional repressor Rex [uncultured Peptoniphilus sp.]
MEKRISESVIRRLPIYHRYLTELIDDRIERISSSELSKLTGFTASQIRQDLNNFGGFGQQGYGYNTQALRDQIDKILGIDKVYNAVLIGVGHLGTAIASYQGFSDSGFTIKALFDTGEKVGSEVDGMEIKPYKELENYLEKNPIDIGIVAVPKEVAQDVVDRLLKHGIKGIWNFAPLDITTDKAVVENVRLKDSLLTLGYYLKNK